MSAPNVSPSVRREVARLVRRFTVEKLAVGWNNSALARELGVWRTNIDRMERGDVIPTLPYLINLCEPLGLRLDFVPAHLQPLLELDEFEVQALLVAARSWSEGAPSKDEDPGALIRALRKLSQIRVEGDGDEVDAD